MQQKHTAASEEKGEEEEEVAGRGRGGRNGPQLVWEGPTPAIRTKTEMI